MSESDSPISPAIANILLRLKEKPEKEGIDLIGITKKLSEKKFGKK